MVLCAWCWSLVRLQPALRAVCGGVEGCRVKDGRYCETRAPWTQVDRRKGPCLQLRTAGCVAACEERGGQGKQPDCWVATSLPWAERALQGMQEVRRAGSSVAEAWRARTCRELAGPHGLLRPPRASAAHTATRPATMSSVGP